MNLQIAVVAALFAVAASTQARTLTPVQASLSTTGTARHVAAPVLAAPSSMVAPVAIPAATMTMPEKSAIAVPPGFKTSPFRLPPAIGFPWTGHVNFRGPDTRQPPVVPEASSSHCGAAPC